MPNIRTPVCDLFGIEYPIFAAGMGGVTMAPLAGAVSKAGGLGTLGGTFSTPEQLGDEIDAVRRITDKPFGVGLIIPTDIPPERSRANLPPFPEFLADLLPMVAGLSAQQPPTLTLDVAKAQLAVALKRNAPLVVCGLGTPAWAVEQCHAAGAKIMSVVGSAAQAREVAALGVDGIIAQGSEAGGHVGSISTLVLVPQVVDAVSVPVLAAGGIVDGRGIATAFTLGAQGAWMGTRFIATPEATTAQIHKTKIVDADERATVVSRCYTGKPSRVLRNTFTQRWAGHENEILKMPWQRLWLEDLVMPARQAGIAEIANYPTGQAASAIHDITPAGELVEQLVRETIAALEDLRRRIPLSA